MTDQPLPAHLRSLSASKLSCWDWCPAEFRNRYILKLPPEPNVDLAFGRAVHKGLELHHKGEDAELGFLRAWQEETAALKAAGAPLPNLTQRGLEVIDAAAALGYTGIAEQPFVAKIVGLPPVYGIVDLVNVERRQIVDWKTAAWQWKPGKVAYQVYQPGLYAHAMMELFEVEDDFSFEFVVLPKAQQAIQRIDATKSAGDIARTLMRMREVYEAMKVEQTFACSKRCGRHQDAV